MLDANKPLEQLYREWCTCQKCSLGQHRMEVGGQFVFGEGVARGVLFISEGPGRTEEQHGRPFVGPSGELLRTVINRFGLTNYYMTNVVACRSCSVVTDEHGQPRMTRPFRNQPALPMYRDEPPNVPQRNACTPRLLEQIYLLDPIVIVSLGGPATEVLTGRSITITQERGKERHISIPGASFTPNLTEKRGVWLRKVGGEMVRPVNENEVKYLMVPTLHPAYVLRQFEDRRTRAAFPQFCADIRKAVKIYEQYMYENFGITVGVTDVSDAELEQFVDEAHQGGTDENGQ